MEKSWWDRLCISGLMTFRSDSQNLPTNQAVGYRSGSFPVKDLVNEPFAVINADDYYGKEAFVKVHDYLVEEHPARINLISVWRASIWEIL